MQPSFNPAHIKALLNRRTVPDSETEEALDAASAMRGLTLEQTAVLLAAHKAHHLDSIIDLARSTRWALTGNRVFVHVPVRCPGIGTGAGRHSTGASWIDSMTQAVASLAACGHTIVTLHLPDDSVTTRTLLALQNRLAGRCPAGTLPLLRIRARAFTARQAVELAAGGLPRLVHMQLSYHRPTYQTLNTVPHESFDSALLQPHTYMAAGARRITLGIRLASPRPEYEALCLLSQHRSLKNIFGHGARTLHLETTPPADHAGVKNGISALARITAVLTLAAPECIISVPSTPPEGGEGTLVDMGATFIATETYDHAAAIRHGDMRQRMGGACAMLDTTIRRLLRDYGVIPALCIRCYNGTQADNARVNLVDAGIMHCECAPMILQELTDYLMRHGSAATVDAARGALMREFAALDFSRQEAVRPALRELLGPRF